MHSTPSLPHVLVVGGGIAGLAAAARLRGVVDGTVRARVTLLEASPRFGGKLLSGEVGGVRVDLGAESMLARRPEATTLARAVGLADALQPPSTAKASIWTRGELRPLPTGHLMGVPGDLDALAASGVLSAEGLARAAEDLTLPRTEVGEDIGVGEYVAARLGHEVVDRLVEPLLGGVYAGHADAISLSAAVPQLLAIAQRSRSAVEGVRAALAGAAKNPNPAPVFTGLDGGIGAFPGAVAEACRAAGAELRTDTPVAALRRTANGWDVVTEDGGTVTADAVVLAVPAPVAARLLAELAPEAAAELGAIEYAGMALVTLAYDRAELGPLPGSGFLVPPVDGRAIKASTFSSNKWGWLDKSAPDRFLLRTSLGRQGEEAVLDLDDDELVALSRADLREAAGITATPYAQAVTRWRSGLPQYPVGHPQRVARVEAAVAALPGLALCGAAYHGVGIPACIADGWRAATTVTAGEVSPDLLSGTQ
ncbi:protoporphyrinogen oxidase [Streptacidiphilus pinicola]|uniref:Coproporphyrinogen III oxidase n=1 Tax=Streptacidiphilus pinicola TaxID=2219663 RepID=A0A2X0IMM4_9ACTN|nr:protoporphyrinogen oxidase [Streptacidiphilus pinicola]RAG86384.1 protoporphyrinogen oxidase [Streptacidiphilus pinicola]